MAAKKRTTLRSSRGKKLYAERNADGTISDIQSYKRAQGQDIKRVKGGDRGAEEGWPSRTQEVASCAGILTVLALI